MSTANLVPETWELSGDDAWRTLRSTGRIRLLRDAFQRLRVADGFSHARSLAFLTSLVLVQAVIALVGLGSIVGNQAVADGISRTIENAVPGPAGQLLTAAVGPGREAGSGQQYLAIALGTIGMLVTATTAFGQVERALNRIYGVEQDRPLVQKYGRGLLLALTAGVLGTGAFLCVAFGSAVGAAQRNLWLDSIWGFARWPIAFALIVAAVAVLFRWCPRRRQPAWSWLAYGAVVSVLLWFLVTFSLGLLFRVSRSFGDTYGPLAGMVALLLWSLLSAMAILFGASAAAQLEAVRSHADEPQDDAKVEASEPSAARPSPSPSRSPSTSEPIGAAR